MLLTAEISVKDYIARYRDTATFGDACRACPNYGAMWCCPPFGAGDEAAALRYTTALIVAFSFRTEADDILAACGKELEKHMDLLLDIERKSSGHAFGFCGQCRRCRRCTRAAGTPCRHPDNVRPPLEAFGFDMCRTASEILGTTLQWSADSSGIRHLTFIGAVFHNLPSAQNLIDTQIVS